MTPAKVVSPRPSIRRVALLVEWSRAYGRAVLQGIGKYVQIHGRWKVYFSERKLAESAPAWLRTWKGDGIIARIENRRLAELVGRLGVPVVDLFEHQGRCRTPAVLVDNGAIAGLAAQHLLERGLKHFAFCGLPGVHSSDDRCTHFAEHLARAGYPVHVWEPRRRRAKSLIADSEDYELQHEEALLQWLKSLPKPVGLMACNDLRAHQIVSVCGDARLNVPEEIAVVGVDNDEVICGLSRPPLSSVEHNPEEVGYQAAVMLEQLMDRPGGRCLERIVVPPRGVVARQSTDIVAIADPDIASALHYIGEHACDHIGVEDVTAHVSLSRTVLKRRFRKLLGRSVHEEIIRVRLKRVQELLSQTDMPIRLIALQTGFRHQEYLGVVFRGHVGQTPAQYRRQSQGGPNSTNFRPRSP